jgi:GH24 family phage-related lysozyme (muramidase)
MPKEPSDYIISIIKKFEGCYLKAYKCPSGVLTIGYGITNADKSITGTEITENLTITQSQADEWLKTS